MKIKISTRLIHDGFVVSINKKSYPVHYPLKIWQRFPDEIRKPYAQYIAFISTLHLAIKKDIFIQYLFPPPPGESFFYYGLVMSMPENITDFENHRLKTSDYLRMVLNSFHNISFSGHPYPVIRKPPFYASDKKTAIVPFSFGKDSLLTYALCKEINIKPIPIFIIEPVYTSENKHKAELTDLFTKEFKENIITFSVPLYELKQTRGLWWGWDIFLTKYTLYLLPYMFYYRAGYFFWSNEMTCNETALDREGFIVNPTFDQSSRWLMTLNSALRLFGNNAKICSLVEPLTETVILYILHHRYPEISRYQTSCFHDAPTSKIKRWCGMCYECARVYVSLLALGFDPKKVGLDVDILNKNKRTLHSIFPKNNRPSSYWADKFTLTRNEKLYAFYLAYKQGIRGKLMDEFKKIYYKKIDKQAKIFKRFYITTHKSITVPEELEHRVLKIYNEELKNLRKIL